MYIILLLRLRIIRNKPAFPLNLLSWSRIYFNYCVLSLHVSTNHIVMYRYVDVIALLILRVVDCGKEMKASTNTNIKLVGWVQSILALKWQVRREYKYFWEIDISAFTTMCYKTWTWRREREQLKWPIIFSCKGFL